MAGMNTDKPGTIVTVTMIDPKVLKTVEAVKAETAAILARLDAEPPKPMDGPTYWPRGYFP